MSGQAAASPAAGASPVPRSVALSVVRAAALDEAAGQDTDGAPEANWALYEELTNALEGWQADGALQENGVLLAEWLAVDLAAYLSLQLADRERLEEWLGDFGDQVCRAQQHAHPAGPVAIEILSVVVGDPDARPDSPAGAERLARIARPFLLYLRAGQEVQDAREMALTLALWAGAQLAALMHYEVWRIEAAIDGR